MKTKLLSVLLVICLCMGALLGCAQESTSLDRGEKDRRPTPGVPLDGEIGGGNKNAMGGVAKDDAMVESDVAADMDAPTGMAPIKPSDSVGDYAEIMPEESAPGGIYEGEYIPSGNIQYAAGMLTGSEWRDNDAYADFIAKLNEQGNGWYEVASRWQLLTSDRIHVRVTSDAVGIKQAKVALLGENGALLWQAVTDADGNAYLFPNALRDGHAASRPTTVTVTTATGQGVTRELAADEREVNISISAQNAPVRLDLMFMVDTTGSMGDELEYLKAELGDVVKRASQNGSIPTRTSVNFYRDVGDEYVVRYYDFREDIGEAVRLIADQRAQGGGDYEEAVHTALDNAVNGHVWDEGAVKLLFLVLDAPPHETDEVIASLAATLRTAAAEGIRIIPVCASGVNTNCEVMFRSYAMLTGGTYTYLTNHSGIGNPHHTPDVESVEVEMLNDLLVRVIGEYCK